MIAGLALQVASLALFIALVAEFLLRVCRSPKEKNELTDELRNSPRWKLFLICMFPGTGW